MKLALATNNAHKLQEIRQILGDAFEELLSLKDLNIDIDIEETGDTLEVNSLLKAKTICDLTGLPTLADDTGLMVDALDGAPGVYSARYAGEEHNDKNNRAYLLEKLEGINDRKAHFATVVTLCYPNGDVISAIGRVDGEILFEEKGEEGFGYDSLFYSYELNKTFAQASADEKNSVSHRSRALNNLLKLLEDKDNV